jgi:hypothetical protein
MNTLDSLLKNIPNWQHLTTRKQVFELEDKLVALAPNNRKILNEIAVFIYEYIQKIPPF